jgi:hypothetical protein
MIKALLNDDEFIIATQRSRDAKSRDFGGSSDDKKS